MCRGNRRAPGTRRGGLSQSTAAVLAPCPPSTQQGRPSGSAESCQHPAGGAQSRACCAPAAVPCVQGQVGSSEESREDSRKALTEGRRAGIFKGRTKEARRKTGDDVQHGAHETRRACGEGSRTECFETYFSLRRWWEPQGSHSPVTRSRPS